MNADVWGARCDELLAAVIAEPDALEHRLVLADWLEEQGEPLGEYIQLACQLATLEVEAEGAEVAEGEGLVDDGPDEENGVRWAELDEAAERIRRRHQRRWLAPQLAALAPPDRPRGPALQIDFSAGLPERLACTPEQLHRTGPELAALPLRALSLRCLPPSDMDPAPDPQLAVLAGHPLLGRIERLRIEGCERVGSLDRRRPEALELIGQLRGGPLRQLALAGGGGWPEAMRAVAELEDLSALTLDFPAEGSDLAPLAGLAQLREFALGASDGDAAQTLVGALESAQLERLRVGRVDAAAAATLLEAPWLDGLCELELGGRPPPREAFSWTRLASRGEAGLPALERLTVGYLRLTAEQTGPFALLGRLRSLVLHNCGLDAATLGQVFGKAPRLRTLDLSGNRLAGGLEVLATKAALPSLETLKLVSAGLRPNDVKPLAGSGAFPLLTDLELDENAIGDAGLVALARGRWPRLRRLSLRYAQSGPLGLRALLDTEGVGDLSSLTLSGNKLGMMAGSLLGAAELGPLRSLRVNACQLGAGGYEALLENPTLSELRELWVDGAEVDAVCRALGRSQTITKLQRLSVFTPHGQLAPAVEASSLQALLAGPCAESLAELRFLFQPLTPAATDVLIASTALPELERLDFDAVQLSLQQRAALRERFGPLAYWGD